MKTFLLSLLIVGLVIQVVRPSRNLGTVEGPDFIGARHALPADVQAVLARACFDCHSNRTNYPWYADLQPAGWWLAYHVKEGKRHLNFSEFGTYSARRADHKLEEVISEVKSRHMPLGSYLWMHPEARLSEAELKLVTDWAAAVRQTIVRP